jgi:periplasmic divalent cation tolerance protein
MTKAVVGLVTCGSRAQARRVARALLTARAAACVNVLSGIESQYWWEGKIESGREWLLMIKTTPARVRQVEQVVKQTHGYQVPEILFLPVTHGERKYLRWLRGAVAAVALALATASARADAVEDWIRQLGAAEEERRAEAAEQLTRIGGARVEEQFRKMIASDNPEHRQVGVVGLLQVSDAAGDLELVRGRLRDENATVRWSAVVALGSSGWVETLPWLREVASGDESDAVREAAREAVAQLEAAIPWRRSLAEALKAGQTSGKPLLVYCRLRHSEYCRQFEEGALADRAVVDAAQEFVPVRLDAARATAEMRRLDVRGAPTILILDAQGHEMDRVCGLVAKATLLERLGAARRGTMTFREAKRQALRDPTDVRANWKVAQAYLEDGREDLAEPHLRNVIAADAANATGVTDNALFTLGFVLGRRGEYAKAVKCLTELLERWPAFKDRDKALYCLGLSQLALGRKAEGRATLEQLLAEFPGSPTAAGAQAALTRLGGK